MKDPLEVLRKKEQELLRVKEEVAALRLTARLLGDQQGHEGDEEDDTPRVVEMP